MSIMSTLIGGAEGFLSGGPVGAAVGAGAGLLSGVGGASSAAATAMGNLGNASIGGILNQEQSDTVANLAQTSQFDSQLQWQSTMFNEMTDERSESMRESNQLRDIAMQQRSADDKIVKEFVKSIGE